ncbi:MAG: response regulator [Bacteroidetes bacterium]|nr:response regulator [Bacteroidota bacterium]
MNTNSDHIIEANNNSLESFPNYRHSNNKVLLIEDNPGDARLVEILLIESDLFDCKIKHCTSLSDGMAELEKQDDYAAVLLDLTLPDSRGFETLERLIEHFPNNNVIVLTGLADKGLGVKAVKTGAQDFLVKGAFDANSLAKSLRYSIERNSVLKRLEETQRRYQDIFSKSKDAIYICTFSGKLADCNQATIDLFDFSREELMILEDVHQIFRPIEKKNEFLLKLQAKKAVKDFEIEIMRKDGEKRYCLVTANVLETENFTGYNNILRDITERKIAEELRKARDIAHQSAKMKEQFIASVSHEMRTPMNAIFGMSNLLIKTELNKEQFNLVHSVQQSSEVLLGIVNDILEISSIQNGKTIFENKSFDLHGLIQNLVNVMQYKVKEKDLRFKVNIAPDVPPFLKGDKLRLNQILYNLVGNAIKFTDRGYIKITIEKLYEIIDSVQMKFSVEDTGIGIPNDKKEAIFDTFTRIRQKDRLFEGTGLGLSIAKNLIEQQGGKIDLISNVGKGSTFYFDLIFEIGDPSEIQDGGEAEKMIDTNIAQKVHLLLVEDHKMNQLVATKTLEKQWPDMKITIAENGKIAVDLLRDQHFDIILMDIQMPVMDGYEATEYIRNKMQPEKALIPILAMTAHAHISKDENFKQHGLDDYVLKPFEPNQLFRKIAFYLNKNTHNA